MPVLTVYARLYGQCLQRTLAGLGKNAWTALLPMALFVANALLGGLVAPLGFVGGILSGLAFDAVVSCYLYFVGEVVSGSQVSLAELRRSVGAYFWSLLNLFFIIFLARFALGALLRGPSGGTAYVALTLVAVVLLNAAPEVIYQRGTYGGLATIQESVSFLQANWLEWLLPNLVLGGALYAVWAYMPLAGLVGLVATTALGGALLHVGMLFRGHLFGELVGSSHRQRMFRYRTG